MKRDLSRRQVLRLGGAVAAGVLAGQRLPNGNTFINEGLSGRLFEVTPGGDVVWEYVSPYFGPAAAPDKVQSNMIFRAYRYSQDEIAAIRGM